MGVRQAPNGQLVAAILLICVILYTAKLTLVARIGETRSYLVSLLTTPMLFFLDLKDYQPQTRHLTDQSSTATPANSKQYVKSEVGVYLPPSSYLATVVN